MLILENISLIKLERLIEYFQKCISKLQSTHCIRRTNIFKVYIVNHNIIFKGDYLDFIKTYNTIYRNAFTVTNVYGHVILDKSINYGKQ